MEHILYHIYVQDLILTLADVLFRCTRQCVYVRSYPAAIVLEQTHTVANAVSDRQLLVSLLYMVILTPFSYVTIDRLPKMGVVIIYVIYSRARYFNLGRHFVGQKR